MPASGIAATVTVGRALTSTTAEEELASSASCSSTLDRR